MILAAGVPCVLFYSLIEYEPGRIQVSVNKIREALTCGLGLAETRGLDMELHLRDKTVLISGGSKGIGKATALACPAHTALEMLEKPDFADEIGVRL